MPNPMTNSALVIDDNWFNRDIFRRALETAGYAVTEAENGTDGIRLLEQSNFHLLILDLQMPRVDGITVLKHLRNHPHKIDTHIIVVTANAHMATDEVDALADYVMLKPINVVQFSEFVTRLKRDEKDDF